MNILITGGTSATALKISKFFLDDKVILVDYNEVPKLQMANYKLISLGVLNAEVIAHNLLNYCLDEQVAMIIPLNRIEFEPLAKSKILFEEYGIDVILPNVDVLEKFAAGKKSTRILMLKKGEVFFDSNPTEKLPDFSDEKTGLYYLLPDGALNLVAL